MKLPGHRKDFNGHHQEMRKKKKRERRRRGREEEEGEKKKERGSWILLISCCSCLLLENLKFRRRSRWRERSVMSIKVSLFSLFTWERKLLYSFSLRLTAVFLEQNSIFSPSFHSIHSGPSLPFIHSLFSLYFLIWKLPGKLISSHSLHPLLLVE